MMEENNAFTAVQKELKQDLAQLEKGEAEFLDIDQLDQELENALASLSSWKDLGGKR